MRRWLVLSYLSVVVIVLALLEIPLGVLTARHEKDLLGVAASQQAASVGVLAGEDIDRGSTADLAALARSYRQQTAGDMMVINSAGKVIADSDGDGAADLALLGPVVAAARAGRNITFATTDEGQAITVSAVPTRRESNATVTGVVVVSLPSAASYNRIRDVWYALAIFAAAMLILTALLGSRVARSVTRPLAELEAAVGRFGAGHLSERAAPSGPPEIRALASQFNRMAGHIEDLLAAQSRFVADASHQLRSPLTALRLRLENLEADMESVPEAGGALAAARREVQRLSRLVDGLLTLSRADAATPQRKPVDVLAVITERVDAWEALADERGVALSAPAGRLHHPRVALVPGDLEQILDNLLANALDATPSGRAIAVDVFEADDEVVVTVTDQGPGMSEEELARAFDRFWQGPGRKGGSSGLGLAIVRQLSRRNGATVDLLPVSAADEAAWAATVGLHSGSVVDAAGGHTAAPEQTSEPGVRPGEASGGRSPVQAPPRAAVESGLRAVIRLPR